MIRNNESGAQDLERNRPPRVHIAYVLDTGGAQRKVELPFVMGVMADLSGDRKKDLPALAQREFTDFKVDNFDARMAAIEPRLDFYVERTIGEVKPGEDDAMQVELTFQKMSDFSPEAVARKVGVIADLLKDREALQKLTGWSDGKSSVAEKLAELLGDPALMKAVAGTPPPPSGAPGNK